MTWEDTAEKRSEIEAKRREKCGRDEHFFVGARCQHCGVEKSVVLDRLFLSHHAPR